MSHTGVVCLFLVLVAGVCSADSASCDRKSVGVGYDHLEKLLGSCLPPRPLNNFLHRVVRGARFFLLRVYSVFFDIADANDDKLLSASEWQVALDLFHAQNGTAVGDRNTAADVRTPLTGDVAVGILFRMHVEGLSLFRGIVDVDGDGCVKREEWITVTCRLSDASLRLQLKIADNNHDGVVSTEEWLELGRRLAIPKGIRITEWQRIDHDKDGKVTVPTEESA